jgi:hypothetical protein
VTAAARVVALKDVWQMLAECAAGYERRATDHYWRVTFNGKTCPTLHLGEHGRRANPDIETGHVRKMARHLEIWDCAKAKLPGIA